MALQQVNSYTNRYGRVNVKFGDEFFQLNTHSTREGIEKPPSRDFETNNFFFSFSQLLCSYSR